MQFHSLDVCLVKGETLVLLLGTVAPAFAPS